MAAQSVEHYCEDKTPFTEPHTLAKTPNLVSAKTYDKGYTPRKPLTKGQPAAAVFGAAKHAGIIYKIGTKTKRSKKQYVWFVDELNNPVLASQCVGLPAPNEYVRHKHSGNWFKVGDVLAPTVALFAVFVKKTANKDTEAKTDKNDKTANKTAVAADSETSDAAADKTSDAAADKTADAAADKTTDTAADKTAVAAADKTAVTADSKTTVTADAAADKTAGAAADKTADAAADKTAVAAADKTAVAAADKTAVAADSKTGREILEAAMYHGGVVGASKAKKRLTPAQGTPKKQVVARFLSSSHTTLLRTIPCKLVYNTYTHDSLSARTQRFCARFLASLYTTLIIASQFAHVRSSRTTLIHATP